MACFSISILTLYPEMFPGPLGFSVSGKALSKKIVSLHPISIRNFALDPHRNVDDTPAGGGPGMIMRADVLARAFDSVSSKDDDRPRLLMSPRGAPLTQKRVKELASCSGIILVCGRFEGVDQRIIEKRNLEEVSVGDYVLSGGELGAFVLLDAVIRLLPGVLGNPESLVGESFEDGLLEHPQYTRPRFFEGLSIPEVLLSGDHKKIALWRRSLAQALTEKRRPDLLYKTLLEKKNQQS